MEHKFAFILCGAQYLPEEHHAEFNTTCGKSMVVTVRDFNEAVEVARNLEKDGVGAIELCGAFGEEQCRRIIECTGGRVAVGYVTHFPDQDTLFDSFFGKK